MCKNENERVGECKSAVDERNDMMHLTMETEHHACSDAILEGLSPHISAPIGGR